MVSAGIELVRELLALQAPLRAMELADRRRQYDHAERVLGADIPAGEAIDADGCAAEWVPKRPDPGQLVVVYFHGGGYCLGSPRSHRHLAASIASAADAAVLSVNYRRAPEYAFPAAVDDAIAATRWLLGRTDAPVVLAGDSAGGGLVAATMIALRDADLPLPVAGVCLSPWVDLTCTAEAHTTLAARDPLLSPTELKRMASSYLRDADPRHPLASPAFAELAGLPPLLIQVGTEEILLDDARRLAGLAHAEGVEVTLQEWPGMIHAWQWYFPVLEEGRRAIAEIAAFIRRHAERKRPPPGKPHPVTGSRATRVVPASLIQEAHLLIAPSTTGRGYLSWVYQLNGQIDAQALTRAIDEVVDRHEILRGRFERRNGRVHLALVPFTPGTLDLIDLTAYTKQAALEAAIEEAEALYHSLSPTDDPRFRATLCTIDPKTSVLAMFVAEALVDSDSGVLLAADISRAYARRVGTLVPAKLPESSEASYLDYVASHPADPGAVTRAREHWAQQARSAPSAFFGWPTKARDGDAGPDSLAFHLTPPEWASVASHAQALGTTPYVFVLTCLQVALAQVASATHLLTHSIVSVRPDTARGVIGNFHTVARIETRLDPDADFESAAGRTAAAVAEAIEHSVVPAVLAAPGAPVTLPSGELLPGIRFYMFSNHVGPVFAGVRRRRLRLHGVAPAPLTVSCIYGPGGRQDFVLSSATVPQARLEPLARSLHAIAHAAGEQPHIPVMRLSLASSTAAFSY